MLTKTPLDLKDLVEDAQTIAFEETNTLLLLGKTLATAKTDAALLRLLQMISTFVEGKIARSQSVLDEGRACLDFEALMAEGVVERVKKHDAEDNIDGLIDPACPALLCDHSGVVKEWIQKKR